MMNEQGKSDGCVVPGKPLNKAAGAAAERVEGRRPAKGNTHQRNASRTQSRNRGAPSELERVRQAARERKDAQFTSLLHHITVELLEQSYYALKRNAALGIDGVTWYAYGGNLLDKLTTLHEQIHRGSYRARPARRTSIRKADGSQRPLSILCLEDKIVQQAVVYVLEAIYEGDFMGFSYGYRPGCS